MLFDILDSNTGIFYTKKVSYVTLINQLTSGITGNLLAQISTLQNTINNTSKEVSKKLDKDGLNFSSDEAMSGPLLINAVLSVFDVAHFNKSIDLHRNKIINVGSPENNYDAANKKYIDDKINNLNVPNASNLILKSGDTMVGFLTLPSTTPTNPSHAVHKKYVDDKFPSNVYLPLAGGSITGALSVLPPTNSNHAATKSYVDNKINPNNYVTLSGGTMTGYLSVLEPILDSHAATKKYVDDKFNTRGVYLPLSGGTMTGYLSVIDPPVNPLDAASKAYVDYKKSISDNCLMLSGGLMTGPLSVLNPNTDQEIATKKYVDDKNPYSNFLPLSGGYMNGPLVLSAYSEKLQFIDFVNSGRISLNFGETPDKASFNNTILIDLSADLLGFEILPTNITPPLNYVYNVRLLIKQKGTIGNFYNVLWTVLTGNNQFTNISWVSGSDGPTISRLTDAVDIIKLSRVGQKWYGFVEGQTFI